jgi:hypothetical protein
MPAPDTLLALLERFQRNLDQYRRPGDNETQVRREFIGPLHTAVVRPRATKRYLRTMGR